VKQEPQPARPADGADPYVGRRLGGRYDVLFRLGAEGDAVAYAARDRDADRKVAVKLLPGCDAATAASAETRLREARRIGSGDDPRVCEVGDVGVAEDGTPFLVLDLLAGRPLARALEEARRFEPRRALDVAWQAASALASAHELGVVHGAVDPSNVWLVTSGGREGVKVLDFFGAARAHASSGAAVPERLGYQAPEVLQGRDPDGRADVYAVGVLLYEMLAGAHPFAGLDGDDLVEATLHVDPEPVERACPDVVPTLAAIVSKAMARDPVQRFGSMPQLVAALEDLRPALDAREPQAPPRAAEPSTPPPRRWGVIAAGVAAAAALGVGATALYRARTAPVVLQLESPAPGAVAVFRGNRHVLPYRERVARGSGPEPIELSAPGYRERKLDLTVDGDVVASLQLEPLPPPPAPPSAAAEKPPPAAEPLAASAVPPAQPARAKAATPPATAPGPRAAPARTAPASRASAPAPRRTGAAAPPTNRIAHVAAPERVLAPSPPAAAPAVVASPAPQPNPKDARGAGAPAPERLAAARPPAEEAPRPVAPPQPAAIAPAVLHAMVKEHRSAIEGCIAEDPTVGGRMLVEVRARADGTLAAVTPRSGGSRVVQRCVVRLLQSFRIPAPGREAVGDVAIDLD